MNGDELFRYFKLYDQGHLEDAYFWNTRITLWGRQKIIDWLYAIHQGYLEKFDPRQLYYRTRTGCG